MSTARKTFWIAFFYITIRWAGVLVSKEKFFTDSHFETDLGDKHLSLNFGSATCAQIELKLYFGIK